MELLVKNVPGWLKASARTGKQAANLRKISSVRLRPAHSIKAFVYALNARIFLAIQLSQDLLATVIVNT